jgi:hypothetical protein
MRVGWSQARTWTIETLACASVMRLCDEKETWPSGVFVRLIRCYACVIERIVCKTNTAWVVIAIQWQPLMLGAVTLARSWAALREDRPGRDLECDTNSRVCIENPPASTVMVKEILVFRGIFDMHDAVRKM